MNRAGVLSAIVATAALLVAGCDKGGEGEGTGTGGGTTPAPSTADGGGQAAQAMGGEDFSIAANFTPLSLAGRSGGTTDASTRGPDCVGMISGSADHTMTVTGSVAATIAVTAEADTTLVIAGPGGPYCNDDTNALNPAVTQTFAAGSYDIFVGNYSSEAGPTPYTLTVTPAVPEGTGMPSMPPMPNMGTGTGTTPTGMPTMPPATPPATPPTTAPTTP